MDKNCDQINYIDWNYEKIKVKVPGIHQWSNEGPFSKQIDFTEIKVGDRYYLDDSDIGQSHNWKLIEITEVRSGVIFFVEVNKKKKKERYILDQCIAMMMGCLQPTEYVVPENHQDMVEYISVCPKTKILYKQ